MMDNDIKQRVIQVWAIGFLMGFALGGSLVFAVLSNPRTYFHLSNLMIVWGWR
ncbi:MAG: hypothetical protein SF162_07585 [bacterium]|nr:hypothetical protein [bacterium]